MKDLIYLDNGATTAMEPEVLKEMEPYFTKLYGNPFGTYGFGAECRMAVEKARRQVAQLIGASPSEIYFTSGGTESDNWAIKSATAGKRRHIVTTQIEHPAVLNTCKTMEQAGFQITRTGIDRQGFADPEEIAGAVGDDTALVSVMTANNEIGTLQPIEKIGDCLKDKGVLFHTDAVQAAGHIPLDVKSMGVHMLSGSGHKFGGPKGVGFLYIRQGSGITAFMDGGAQERKLRAGTHNVPGIVGMGAAAAAAAAQMEQRAAYEIELRDYFIKKVLGEIPGTKLNGDSKKRLPGNCSFTFPLVSGESILIMLDRRGICASAGSACAAGAIEPSYVLSALGLSREDAYSTLRFTLSYRNTKEELDYTAAELKKIVEELRSVSPYA